MSEDAVSIRVNFGRPFPIFPLEHVVLLPHALLRLFIFEPRYRQMVEQVLDGAGQLAMAVFDGDGWQHEYEGSPPVREAVCVGQIVQHQKLGDGNYRIMLHGVCRARILDEIEPDGDLLYRRAMIEPIGHQDEAEEALAEVSRSVRLLLDSEPLTGLASCRQVLAELNEREIPTRALLDVVALSVLNEKRVQYRLLAEGDIHERARVVVQELERLGNLVARANRQHDDQAPKGISWN